MAGRPDPLEAERHGLYGFGPREDINAYYGLGYYNVVSCEIY